MSLGFPFSVRSGSFNFFFCLSGGELGYVCAMAHFPEKGIPDYIAHGSTIQAFTVVTGTCIICVARVISTDRARVRQTFLHALQYRPVSNGLRSKYPIPKEIGKQVGNVGIDCVEPPIYSIRTQYPLSSFPVLSLFFLFIIGIATPTAVAR